MGPLSTSLLSGGTSNVGLRKARILTALHGTDVPHPVCYGSCPDEAVVGAPFYVMEKVGGWASNLREEIIHNEPPFDRMPYEYGIPFAIVDGLMKLANVDYQVIGLGDYGKPVKFR